MRKPNNLLKDSKQHKAPLNLQRLIAEATWSRGTAITIGAAILLAALFTATLFIMSVFLPQIALPAILATITTALVSETTLFAALAGLAGLLGITAIYAGAKLPTAQPQIDLAGTGKRPASTEPDFSQPAVYAGAPAIANSAAASTRQHSASSPPPSPGPDEGEDQLLAAGATEGERAALVPGSTASV